MIARLKSTAAIFATTLVAYLAYHLVAVPFIEPSFETRDGTTDSLEPFLVKPDPSIAFAKIFPPGSWQLDNPKVFENDRSKLLFKEYKNLDNGRVRLFPCAILFYPNSETSGAVTQRVIVLEAPQGALLQFDGPVDLERFKFGQLQTGQMAGPVTIHGTPSRPGANDELFADTRDVKLTPEKISTDAPVNFRFGPNEGHGRRMEINLLPSSRPASGKQRGPNIGGLESFELFHDVQMRLVPGSAGMMPLDGRPSGQKSAPSSKTAAGAAPSASAGPVDIRCQGPFKFDLVKNIAAFQDQVDVFRAAHDGPSDQVNCDRLWVYFAPKSENGAATAKAGTGGSAPPKQSDGPQRTGNLEPRRIEARGNPVFVRGESNGVYARAEHLDYDIATGRILLDDAREVTLRQYSNEIRARSLDYQPGEAGRLGTLDAVGPGWLRAIMPQPAVQPLGAGHSPSQQPVARGITQLGLPVAPNLQPSQDAAQFFEAHWTNELKMRPVHQEHVISLKGNPRVSSTGQGELSADDEIDLWLKELPPTEKAVSGAPPPRWQVVAKRMRAQPNVRINSPQLSGATPLLEAWFERAAPEPEPAQSPSGGSPFGLSAFGPQLPSASPRNPIQTSPGSAIALPNGVGVPRQFGALPAARQRNPAAPTAQRYNVEGERIRLQLLTGGSRTEIQDITIDGQARFGETQTPQPGDVPLLVSGEKIEVLRANAPDMGVTVSGKPAEVAARGLEMYGDVVHMDKWTNRIWIDGPGRMKLPENQTPTARPDASGQTANNRPLPGDPMSIMHSTIPADPMIVTWKDGMQFDGSTAHLEHSVVGQSSARRFQTDTADVSLRRRIDFSQPRTEDRPEIGRIVCRGGMWMESRSFDPNDPKKLKAIDRIQTRDLTINETSGDILGQGPGWLTSLRQGSIDPTQPAGTPARNPASVPISHAVPTSHTAPNPSAKPIGARRRAAGRGGDAADKSQLNYLHVEFAGALSGNLNQHEITFHDHVRTVYGPVLSWEDQLNPDEVDDLGPGGVLMHCDQLTVRQTNAKPAATAPEHHPIELEAIGNTVVEGEIFTARAPRFSYSEAKDLLMLKGDGRNDAQLFRQERPGVTATPTAAQQILYWRSTNRVSVSGFHLFDLNQIPGPDDDK